MHFDLLSVLIIVIVLCAWSLAGLHSYRRARRRRHWQASWNEFRYGHRDVDRELNLFWYREGRR